KITSSYEHIAPDLVGNKRQFVVSELSGQSNVRLLASRLGLDTSGQEKAVLQQIKQMENEGYKFENAEGTVELMLRRSNKNYVPLFKLIRMNIAILDHINTSMYTEATVQVKINDQVFHTVSEGNGPVDALDKALRKALLPSYPMLKHVSLGDYKVRIINPEKG